MPERRFGSAAAFAAIVLATSCAHSEASRSRSACSTSASGGPAVEAIRALEEAGAVGNVTGLSLESAERMFAPDYVSIGPDGSVRTRTEILAAWTTQAWASKFDIQDLRIRVSCDTAIVVGLSEAQGIGAPPGTKPTHFRWLNVWTKFDESWRLAATQYARF